jgi:deoxyribonuclease-1-like protein
MKFDSTSMARCFALSTLLVTICVVCRASSLLFKFHARSTMKVASFNLRRYSLGKASSSDNVVHAHLSTILMQYDLIFLQEIIDVSLDNRVVRRLLEHLRQRSKGNRYEAIISPALGSTSYKERLVYLYRKTSAPFEVLSSHVYNGSSSDAFERAPFILHVKLFSSKKPMVFIGVHLKPDRVYEEFRCLRGVVDELQSTSSVMLLGDFNADCSYLNKAKRKELRDIHFNDFDWLIDDRTETNLVESCSYDRILISARGTSTKKVSWKMKSNRTFTFDKVLKLSKQSALKISDHYPVEVELY